MILNGKYKPVFAIVVFYAIAVLLRYLTNETGVLAQLDNAFLKTVVQGIGPAAGAWIACALFGIRMEMSLQGNFRNLLLPLSLYWLFPTLLLGGIAYYIHGTAPLIPIFAILTYALFEEIGWRGFLQQMLRPLPKVAGILLIAILWFVWHLDFELTAQNLIFFGILILGSWGIGVVADKTRSLLCVAAFHSLNNLFGTWGARELLITGVLLCVWIAGIRLFRGNKKTSPETAR